MPQPPTDPLPWILMTRDLLQPIPAPVWPAGVELHPFAPEQAGDVHQLLADAYRDGGGRVAGFDVWWSALSNDAEFDPAIVFVARTASLEIIGVAQCWTAAFVKDLAVRRDWRGRGVGTALLLHAFGVFKARGATAVRLKVEQDNPSGAIRLYRSVGMRD